MRCFFRNAAPLVLTLALSAVPAAVLAAPPAPAPPAQVVPLRYARPWDLLKMLHWDGTPDAHPVIPLPVGVRKIGTVSDENALQVEGTDAGVAKVRDIASLLDIAPRFVRVQVQFVRARVSDVAAAGIDFNLLLSVNGAAPDFLPAASGPSVSALLQKLEEAQPEDEASATLVTSNNTTASATLRLLFPRLSGAASGSGRYTVGADASLTVNPRVNSDDTTTLLLIPTLSADDPTAPRAAGLHTLRTLRSGETMVLTGFGMDAQTELLLFVTPTLLPRQP